MRKEEFNIFNYENFKIYNAVREDLEFFDTLELPGFNKTTMTLILDDIVLKIYLDNFIKKNLKVAIPLKEILDIFNSFIEIDKSSEEYLKYLYKDLIVYVNNDNLKEKIDLIKEIINFEELVFYEFDSINVKEELMNFGLTEIEAEKLSYAFEKMLFDNDDSYNFENELILSTETINLFKDYLNYILISTAAKIYIIFKLADLENDLINIELKNIDNNTEFDKIYTPSQEDSYLEELNNIDVNKKYSTNANFVINLKKIKNIINKVEDITNIKFSQPYDPIDNTISVKSLVVNFDTFINNTKIVVVGYLNPVYQREKTGQMSYITFEILENDIVIMSDLNNNKFFYNEYQIAEEILNIIEKYYK